MTTFKKISQEKAYGTSLQGYIDAKYSKLYTVFGNTNGVSEDGKINNSWIIEIDGNIATIYDYKENLNTGDIEQWHIGGKNKLVVELVEKTLWEYFK